MSDAVRIGILGDFNPDFRSHHATTDSLQHAAHKLGTAVESEWIPTPSLMKPGAEKKLESFDGLWASPGSLIKELRERTAARLPACLGFRRAPLLLR